jgi:hypothetical protein
MKQCVIKLAHTKNYKIYVTVHIAKNPSLTAQNARFYIQYSLISLLLRILSGKFKIGENFPLKKNNKKYICFLAIMKECLVTEEASSPALHREHLEL